MIDHISLRVIDFEKALNFYKAALKPLGYEVLMQFPGAAGLGADGKADFWIGQSDKTTHPSHIAFSTDRKAVDAFHAAALAAGGTDHGAPGIRGDYHPHYYAAFILDAEGNNVEAVCHTADGNLPKPAATKSAKRPGKKAAKSTKKGAAKAKPAKAKKAVKKAAPKAKKAAPKKAAPKAKKAAKKAVTKAAPKAKKAVKKAVKKAAPKAAKKAAPKAKKAAKKGRK